MEYKDGNLKNRFVYDRFWWGSGSGLLHRSGVRGGILGLR